MANSGIAACLLVGLLGACAAQPAHPSVEFDGPVSYTTTGFPGSGSELHLMVNGSASLHISIEAGTPRDFTGQASAAELAALHDDIAAADLGSLSHEYTCPDTACDAPEPIRTIVVEASGGTTQISVDSRVSDAQLPARLVKVFQDLEAIAAQLSSSAGS
jgi:hypothetical protein